MPPTFGGVGVGSVLPHILQRSLSLVLATAAVLSVLCSLGCGTVGLYEGTWRTAEADDGPLLHVVVRSGAGLHWITVYREPIVPDRPLFEGRFVDVGGELVNLVQVPSEGHDEEELDYGFVFVYEPETQYLTLRKDLGGYPEDLDDPLVVELQRTGKATTLPSPAPSGQQDAVDSDE